MMHQGYIKLVLGKVITFCENLATVSHVFFHDDKFLIRELVRLVENIIRHMNLADVMDDAANRNFLNFCQIERLPGKSGQQG